MSQQGEEYAEIVRAHLQRALDAMKAAKANGYIIEFSLVGTEITHLDVYQKQGGKK